MSLQLCSDNGSSAIVDILYLHGPDLDATLFSSSIPPHSSSLDCDNTDGKKIEDRLLGLLSTLNVRTPRESKNALLLET